MTETILSRYPLAISKAETFTVTRTTGTTDAVSVDIVEIPDRPQLYVGIWSQSHSGYELVKSTDLPLTVIEGLGAAAPGIAAVVVLPDETTLSANYPNPVQPGNMDPLSVSQSE